MSAAAAYKNTPVKFKGKIPRTPPKDIVLPPLDIAISPNRSPRLSGVKPFLICLHRPVGKYGPSISWLSNPESQASAHVITEGNGTGVDVATMLVPWDQKAWACEAFNSISYNIEIDDDAWNGKDLTALYTAARLAAFLSVKTRIPAASAEKAPHNTAGVVRHIALGAAGGGHTDPTTDLALFRFFIKQMQREIDRGGFRPTYGQGTLYKIPAAML